MIDWQPFHFAYLGGSRCGVPNPNEFFFCLSGVFGTTRWIIRGLDRSFCSVETGQENKVRLSAPFNYNKPLTLYTPPSPFICRLCLCWQSAAWGITLAPVLGRRSSMTRGGEMESVCDWPPAAGFDRFIVIWGSTLRLPPRERPSPVPAPPALHGVITTGGGTWVITVVVVIVVTVAWTVEDSRSLLPPSSCSTSSSFNVSWWQLGLRIRSGRGLEGARPYLNCVDGLSGGVSSAFSCPPDPVLPTKVTELRLDGEEGPLVPDSATDRTWFTTDNCNWLLPVNEITCQSVTATGRRYCVRWCQVAFTLSGGHGDFNFVAILLLFVVLLVVLLVHNDGTTTLGNPRESFLLRGLLLQHPSGTFHSQPRGVSAHGSVPVGALRTISRHWGRGRGAPRRLTSVKRPGNV